MTKENFKKNLKRFLELREATEKLEDTMRKSILKDDFNGGLYGIGWWQDLALSLLEDATDDKFEYLVYWIYDLECGKKWKKGKITDENNKDIKLKTIDDLIKVLY